EHSLRRGGFRPRLVIGRGSREGEGARMRASKGSLKQPNSSRRQLRKKQCKSLIEIMLVVSFPTTPIGWRRIPRRFLTVQLRKTHSVICLIAAPAKSLHFCVSSHRPDTSNSFARRNHKKAHRWREQFDRLGLRHNTVMC